MSKRFRIPIFGALAHLSIVALLAIPALAQSGTPGSGLEGAWWFLGEAPPSGPLDMGTADLTGVWSGRAANDLSTATLPGEELILTAYGYERYQTVDHAQDPNTFCLPPGPSRMMIRAHPTMIVQRPDVVVVLSESQYTFRLIYTDGRAHPDYIDEYPEWTGHAVGRWEGDTLVVDTVGIHDRTWLDSSGHEHSDQLHLTERLRLADPNTLEYTVTYSDPVFFVKPFTTRQTLQRVTAPDRILSHACADNERDIEHLQPTIGGNGLARAVYQDENGNIVRPEPEP
jgi:hypothetical protein